MGFMILIASAVSALLLAFSLPNEAALFGIPLLGFFCLSPLFAALARTKSDLHAAIAGAVFGAVAHASSSYWLYFFQDFAIWTIGATTVAYSLLYAFLGVFLRRFSRMPGASEALRPFLMAAAWTVWEWQKSIGFLGYPWGLVAYSVNEVSILTQIADSTGIYGLTFLLALSSALVAEVVRKFSRPMLRSFVVFASILIWFGAYGVFRLSSPTPVVDKVPLLLVQHNADSWESGGEMRALSRSQELTREGLRKMRTGGAALAGGEAIPQPALVAWSETVLRRPYEDYLPFFRKNPVADPFVPFLSRIGVPLLTGAPVVLDWEKYDATNSAILLGPDGGLRYSYAKRHPVPFAESIPFWEYQWMRDFMKRVVGLEGGWVMGSEATVMTVPTPSGRDLRFGVPICFEDAFPDVCADFFRGGADILINITNDSWSRMASSETQHFAAARFRAIENRRVLVRSTNGGYTVVVDAEGRVAADLPLFEAATLPVLVSVQRSERQTTYFLLGDWLPLLLAIVLGFSLLRGALFEFAEANAMRTKSLPALQFVSDEDEASIE